jgi:prepilin-type N-terminal cleavage/methylation domain-containing protein
MEHKVKAFTLIETIVVMGIVAIASALTAVSFYRVTAKKLEGDARKVVSDLNWIKQRAMSSHITHAISFDDTNNTYSLYISPNGTTGDFTEANLLKKVELDVILNLTEANLWFYSPKGDAWGFENVTLEKRGKTKTIRVFRRTGHIKME